MNTNTLKLGDVVVVKKGGWGLGDHDIDKCVTLMVEEYPYGWTVEGYDCELSSSHLSNIWEQAFGENPLVLLNVFDKPEKETIAKPILEERKVGKVKMHLVDEGFPNAMMELGKMMGWAEEHKGYKPNDFKNLPNAEVEFSAAATRHRLKGFIQKAEGVPAIERVDEESGISHLCHAAFNCLAELELVLTGKIK